LNHRELLEKVNEIKKKNHPSDRLVNEVMTAIKDAHEAYYWVGVYLLKGEMLHLGPFAGPPTDHVKIPVGRGVCGTAVATGEDQNIADVTQLDNYLACNIYTKAELVSLIHDADGKIVGQIDIDATVADVFKEEDVKLMTEIGKLISDATVELAKQV